jgi:malonyl-CoA O-methyltransferase
MALVPGSSEPALARPDSPRVSVRVETVRRQFDRRASRFARGDFLPREVGRRLLERLDGVRLTPRRILDVGCGGGAMRAPLVTRFADASWIGVDLSLPMLTAAREADFVARVLARWRGRAGARVCADAAALPFADGAFDLVLSNLMLHWHPAPHAVLREWNRVLAVGGLLLFSCFGPDTLRELRAACAEALPAAAPMPFTDMHDYGDMLIAAGFAAPVMEMETLRLTYPSPSQLVREVRLLGGNPRDDRARGLPSGARARALLQALHRQRGADGRIALTFEIVYGHAWKPPPRAQVTRITVEGLRAQLRAR